MSQSKNKVDSLCLDKDVLDLSLEELEDVLVQVTDHSIPYNKKCPLVRRLNDEASKDESSLESCVSSLPSSFIPKFLSSSSSTPNSFNSSRVENKKFKNLSCNSKNIFKKVDCLNKKVSTSQSLQDLATFCKNTFGDVNQESMRSFGNNKAKNTTRANSLSVSQIAATQNKNIDSDLCELNKRCSSASGKLSSSVKNNRNRINKMKQTQSSPVFDVQLASSNTACDFDSGLREPNSSQRYSKSCSIRQEIKQTNNCVEEKCDRELNSNTNVLSNKVLKEDSDLSQENNQYATIEMEDLGKKVEIAQYSTTRESCSSYSEHSVLENNNNLLLNRSTNYKSIDTFVNIDALSKTGPITASIAERVVNHNPLVHSNDETVLQNVVLSDENKNVQSMIDNDNCERNKSKFQTGSFNDHLISNPTGNHSIRDPSLLVNLSLQSIPRGQAINNFHQSKPDNIAKKKKKIGNEIRSEDIEGHIGYKDIDYLAKYVAGSKNGDNTPINSDVKNLNFNSKEVKDSKKKSSLSNSSSINNNNGKKKTSSNFQCASNNENRNEIDQNEMNDSQGFSNDSGLAKSIPSCSSTTTIDSKFSPEIAQNDLSSEIDSLVTSPELSKSHLPQFLNETSKLTNFQKNLKSSKKIEQRTISQSSDIESLCFEKNENLSSLAKNSEFNINDEEKRYAASDSEMVDQETGFQPIKSKHIRKRKARLRKVESIPKRPYLEDVSATPSLESPNSRPPINTLFTRGYESEREYCADEYRKRKDHQCKRKLASSMPHSEQNSADNSDLESSFSFPVTGRVPSLTSPPMTSISSTPKVSYADIAKMGPTSLGSLPPNNNNSSASNPIKNSKSIVNSANPTTSNSSELNESSKLSLSKVLDKEQDLKKNEILGCIKSFELVSLNEEKGFNINLTKSNEIKSNQFEFKSNLQSDSKTLEALISPFVTKTSSKFEIGNKKKDKESLLSSKDEASICDVKSSSQMKKSNSITECNIKSQPHRNLINQSGSLPPVIMCDDSYVRDDICSFTFGFFEDVKQPTNTTRRSNLKSSEEKLNLSQAAKEVPSDSKKLTTSKETNLKTSLEDNFSKKIEIKQEYSYMDIDKASFNYNKIINFIRTAWENVLRDYRTYAEQVTNSSTDGSIMGSNLLTRHIAYYHNLLS